MASEESAIRPASGKLSKNLLALKFMQRQVEADKRQELEQQRIRHEAEAKWGQKRDSVRIETLNSYSDIDDQALNGRMSFQQANTAVEAYNDTIKYRMLQEKKRVERKAAKAVPVVDAASQEQDAFVSNEEMAQRYKAFVKPEHQPSKREGAIAQPQPQVHARHTDDKDGNRDKSKARAGEPAAKRTKGLDSLKAKNSKKKQAKANKKAKSGL
eukprot:m.39138 g.39138  ORF g.39138 m.39138 type:complete len:213 (-) comp12640_c0_seq6:310-948(-)